VNSGEEVLLFRDGILIGRLSEGLHVFWKGTGKVAWKAVDRRETTLDVAGQEIMTADKVTLRVNLIVTYQVTDPVRSVTAVADAAQAPAVPRGAARFACRDRRQGAGRPAVGQGIGGASVREGPRVAGAENGTQRSERRPAGHHPAGRHERRCSIR